jgi:hypothetical protein
MGFYVDQGSPRTVFAPIDTVTGTSLYVGQLVKNDSVSLNGMAPLAVASGTTDKSQLQSIYGVVVGDNNETAKFLATYGQYQITQNTVALQAANPKLGNAGMYAIGDPQPLVKVATITPNTVLRANIYNATVGVAPTVATVASGSSTAGFTTNSIDVATVANMCTAYCRTGANAGRYRVVLSASATAHTFTTLWPVAPAVGDTFVIVPMKVGYSFVQINSTSTYIGMGFDCAATAATNYFGINVLELDLREAGKETVLFTFDPIHCSTRALS